MIIKATKSEEQLLIDTLGSNAYLDTLIYSDFLAYCDYGISSVYIIKDDKDKSFGAFAVYGNSISASVPEDSNVTELIDFCIMSPDIATIELPPTVAQTVVKKLNARVHTQNIMLYEGVIKQKSDVNIDFTPQLWQVYRLLQQVSPAFMLQSGFENWLVDKSHKVRHRVAELALIYDGENAVATAGIYSRTPKYALIESVAVLPKYRSKGYASAIIDSLVNHALENGQTPILSCDDNLVTFYEKVGFKQAEKLASVCIK